MPERPHTPQVIGSLLAAAAIVAITILVVTAKLGPTSAAEREVLEERLETREELREQRQELREERESNGR